MVLSQCLAPRCQGLLALERRRVSTLRAHHSLGGRRAEQSPLASAWWPRPRQRRKASGKGNGCARTAATFTTRQTAVASFWRNSNAGSCARSAAVPVAASQKRWAIRSASLKTVATLPYCFFHFWDSLLPLRSDSGSPNNERGVHDSGNRHTRGGIRLGRPRGRGANGVRFILPVRPVWRAKVGTVGVSKLKAFFYDSRIFVFVQEQGKGRYVHNFRNARAETKRTPVEDERSISRAKRKIERRLHYCLASGGISWLFAPLGTQSRVVDWVINSAALNIPAIPPPSSLAIVFKNDFSLTREKGLVRLLEAVSNIFAGKAH